MRENSPSQVDGDSQIEETEPTDGGPGGEIVSEERSLSVGHPTAGSTFRCRCAGATWI